MHPLELVEVGDGPERARYHGWRCRARSVMMMMLVAFMMVVSSLALTAVRLMGLMRELVICENDVKYARPRNDNRKALTYHKAQGLFLADALASHQDLINNGEFADPFTTWALPVYNGTVLGR